MIQSMIFNVGQRVGKWYACWDDPDGRMEGPARDTKAEAIADREHAAQLAMTVLRRHMPGAVITKERIQ